MNCAPHLGFFFFVCFQTYGAIMHIAEHPPLLIRGHFTFNRIVKLCILGSLTVNVMWQSYGHTCDTLPYDTIRQSHVTVTYLHIWLARDNHVMVTCDCRMLLLCDSLISTRMTDMFTHATVTCDTLALAHATYTWRSQVFPLCCTSAPFHKFGLQLTTRSHTVPMLLHFCSHQFGAVQW